MRRFLPLFLAFSLTCSVVANAQSDAKSKAVLQEMTKKMSSLKSMKANFVLNITGTKVKDTKKGNIALKGEKYHISLSGQEIICDTKTVWTYNIDAKEVQVSAYNPSEQSMSPAKLLTNSYEKEYQSVYKGEKKEKGKTFDVVELKPIDANSKVNKIELLIDKSTSVVSSGNIWEKNGNRIQYTISNFTPNAPVTDALFSWNAKEHAGIEVVDLR